MNRSAGDGHFVALLLDGPGDAAALRARVEAVLLPRFPKAPVVSPILTAKLDPIAARIASGALSMAAGMREVSALVKAAMKSREMTGSTGMNAFVVELYRESELSVFVPPEGAGAVGIGIGRGDVGAKDGIQRTVVVVVATGEVTMK